MKLMKAVTAAALERERERESCILVKQCENLYNVLILQILAKIKNIHKRKIATDLLKKLE